MGIILLEASDPSQSSESTRQFITMEYSKVCHTQWQLPPRARTMIKHYTINTPNNVQTRKLFKSHTSDPDSSLVSMQTFLFLLQIGTCFPIGSHDASHHGQQVAMTTTSTYSIMLPVARCHPQFAVVNIRRHNFLKTTFSIFRLQVTSRKLHHHWQQYTTTLM